MMKHRLLRILSITSLVMMLLFITAGIALAVDYYLYVKVSSESGTSDYAPLALVPDLNNQSLADLGYISDSGRDTRVTYAGDELPHMVAEDKLAFVAPEVEGGIDYDFRYTMGNDPLSSFAIVPGYDGYVTVADDASLELGDSFEIELKGWIDTASGSDKNLIYKLDAFKVYISAAEAITADINNGTVTVTATGVSSGIHTIKVTADGINLKIYIDTIEKGSASLGATSVTDNANSWTLMQNNVMPYMEYIKIWTAN